MCFVSIFLLVGWNALRNACQALMQQFLSSADWKHRHAALLAISQVGEVVPQDEIGGLVRSVLFFFFVLLEKCVGVVLTQNNVHD